MRKFRRLVCYLWELILALATSLILVLFFLFPSIPELIDKILWIVFVYLLSNVLNYILSELKPPVLKIETIPELSLLRKDMSEVKTSLERMESKLDKLLK